MLTIQVNEEFVEDAASLAESILASIADAVIYAGATGRIRRWNPAAADLFGYSPTEVFGRSLDLIIPEPLRAECGAGSFFPGREPDAKAAILAAVQGL